MGLRRGGNPPSARGAEGSLADPGEARQKDIEEGRPSRLSGEEEEGGKRVIARWSSRGVIKILKGRLGRSGTSRSMALSVLEFRLAVILVACHGS
jgi:hypothetical protein